ncbi:MAG: hypothetical protein Q8O43_08750 [Dehalococcoidia bacterium]|nr:hypothetical protein [Dehalococcoidia bacterium]
MPNEYVSKEELEKERIPSELWDWLIQKVNQICSTEEGRRAFRLQNDKEKLIKKLVEEIAPLAIFSKHKFGDTDQVLLKPVIGNQNYDAIVNDLRTKPASQSYLEITQAHEGANDYWRRCELLQKGIVFSNAPVIKIGKGKNRQVSIPPEATSVEEGVKTVLKRIIEAAKGKAGKNYPANTSLIIFFDDTTLSEERLKVINHTTIDSFVEKEIMNLDLRFSQLYLVGEAKKVFREYPIKR